MENIELGEPLNPIWNPFRISTQMSCIIVESHNLSINDYISSSNCVVQKFCWGPIRNKFLPLRNLKESIIHDMSAM